MYSVPFSPISFKCNNCQLYQDRLLAPHVETTLCQRCGILIDVKEEKKKYKKLNKKNEAKKLNRFNHNYNEYDDNEDYIYGKANNINYDFNYDIDNEPTQMDSMFSINIPNDNFNRYSHRASAFTRDMDEMLENELENEMYNDIQRLSNEINDEYPSST